MTRWLTLALALCSSVASGCYASYGLSTASDDGGVGDAGPGPGDAFYIPDLAPVDFGLCPPLPSTVGGLTCPSLVAPGDPVLVTVQHASATACCTEPAAHLVPQRTGPRVIALETSWDSCSCCLECDCVGPTVRQALDLGPLEAGTWTVIADAARGVTCTIDVRAFWCNSQPATDVIVPTAVRLGDQVPVLLRAPGAGCNCTPRGTSHPGSAGGTFLELEACSCHDLDPCMDPGYEATALVDGASIVGPWTAASSAGVISTQIVYPDACVSAPSVVSLTPIGVDPSFIHDSPVGVFARVEYDESFCCGAPAPVAVERFSPDPTAHYYELLDCAGLSCLCDPAPPPQRLDAIVYLGQLPPGPQRVFLGALETTIDVPSR
jgi:hypothetical protein